MGIERSEKVPMVGNHLSRALLAVGSCLTTEQEKGIPRSQCPSSIYVPLISPPINVPKFVKIDPASQWHKSGFLSTGDSDCKRQAQADKY